jgi:hypothetical protein
LEYNLTAAPPLNELNHLPPAMKKCLPAIVFFVILASCKQENNPIAARAINESLERSNTLIAEKNKLVYSALEEKAHDLMTQIKADIWRPRAVRVSAFDALHSIMTISSSYVKAGQSVEVTAGIGQFTKVAKPHITIDGKEGKLDDGGVAVYTFSAKGKPGKYQVPVIIEFYNPDGTLATLTRQLEYVIAK